MKFNYQQVQYMHWMNGTREHPLGAALIWLKPTNERHALYVSIDLTDDGTSDPSHVTKTHSIDTLIDDAKRFRDCDIIRLDETRAIDEQSVPHYEEYLQAVTAAYLQGPVKPAGRMQNLMNWYWQCLKSFFASS